MSAYREQTTEMNDVDCLKKALTKVPTREGKADKHFEPVVHKEKVQLEGYHGDKRKQMAEIVIPRQQVGGASNDIGFERGADGNFTAHISDYDRGFYNQKWLNGLKVEYAKEKAIKTAKSVGAVHMGTKSVNGKTVMRWAVKA
jgi:hypothetical protein